jgi:hypothetical protein
MEFMLFPCRQHVRTRHNCVKKNIAPDVRFHTFIESYNSIGLYSSSEDKERQNFHWDLLLNNHAVKTYGGVEL